MIAKIEQMILERLREKGVPIDTTGRNMPSAYAVVECGAITETGRNRRQRDIDANLTLVFCTSDRDAEQRDMIRAVLQQAVDALADQSLGLPMEPMAFAGIENITSERGSQSGLSVYQLRFMTRHDVTLSCDEVDSDFTRPSHDCALRGRADKTERTFTVVHF